MNGGRSMIVVGLGLSLVSCAGVQKAGSQGVKSIQRIAVVEVAADPFVTSENPQEGQSKTSSLKAMFNLAKTKSLTKTAEAATHSTGKVLEASMPALFSNLKADGRWNALDEKSVTGHPAYKAMAARAQTGEAVLPMGYRALDLSKPEKAAELCKALRVDGLMTFRVKYMRRMSSGVGQTGKVTGSSEIGMTLIDSSGKPVWQSSAQRYWSEGPIPILDGVYDKSKLDPLLVKAFDATAKALLSAKDLK